MELSLLNQLVLTFLLLLPIILISRTVVAGTRYSPILIIVVFGLIMGYLLVNSKVASRGLSEFPIIILMSKVTIIVLIVSFFVGGQELRKIIFKKHLDIEELVIPSQDQIILGTKRTQFVFIVRSIFILLGIASAYALFIKPKANDPIADFYPLLMYIGLVFSVILIDNRAMIKNTPAYIRKGVFETISILLVLLFSYYVAQWIKPVIALPQIFFAMVISSTLGFFLVNWQFGPTIRAMLFAGIPVVLAANFLVGGSRIIEAFKLADMQAVMSYGFFGQILWMFGGLALLIFVGKGNHVRNLAPGMAGSLSHSGLTGACTAGDLGQEAAARAPIMINVPFLGHIFVFSILALSAKQGRLTAFWVGLIAIIGIILTIMSLINMSKSSQNEAKEVKALMIFCLGWQLTAVFGSFMLLYLGGMTINNSAMATSSALSHFGLFTATQNGMFGNTAADLIPFIFAMPFLVHPLVFGLFGKAMTNDGVMPAKTILILSIIGLVGVIFSLIMI